MRNVFINTFCQMFIVWFKLVKEADLCPGKHHKKNHGRIATNWDNKN